MNYLLEKRQVRSTPVPRECVCNTRLGASRASAWCCSAARHAAQAGDFLREILSRPLVPACRPAFSQRMTRGRRWCRRPAARRYSRPSASVHALRQVRVISALVNLMLWLQRRSQVPQQDHHLAGAAPPPFVLERFAADQRWPAEPAGAEAGQRQRPAVRLRATTISPGRPPRHTSPAILNLGGTGVRPPAMRDHAQLGRGPPRVPGAVRPLYQGTTSSIRSTWDLAPGLPPGLADLCMMQVKHPL